MAAGSAVVAADESDNQTSVLNDSESDVEAASTGISYGDTVTSELSEESAYDEDFNGYHENYTFHGEAGDEISLEMRPNVGDGVEEKDHAAQIRLYDPDGELVETAEPWVFRYGAADLAKHEIEETGTYTIVATTAPHELSGGTYPETVDSYDDTEESYFDTFEYELRLHESVGDGRKIDYGETVRDELTGDHNYQDSKVTNGYYDVFTFDAEDGDEISLEMRPNGSVQTKDHAAQIRLYDPDGERVETAEPWEFRYGAADLAKHEIEETGTYTIVATTAPHELSGGTYPETVDSYDDSEESLPC